MTCRREDMADHPPGPQRPATENGQSRCLPSADHLRGFDRHRTGLPLDVAAPLALWCGTGSPGRRVPLLFGASVDRFRAAGTPVPARKPTTAIVQTGPYRFSRNPIYLAFSLQQMGIAVWVNS